MNEQLTKFVAIVEEREQVEERLAELKKEQARLEQVLLQHFERDGISSVKCNGRTVYLHRSLVVRAKDNDRDRVLVALRSAGLTDYVEESWNTSSVQAYVRECERNNQDLPAQLAEALEQTELFFVRTRRS